ncbi:MAG: DUF1552 domain-containing protein [Archangium sp.]|nr:DUF1552 domain-containing protein [Archangium sp.]
MSRPRLTRRLVLRGAGGAAVALPLLSLDAKADPAPAPKRFVFFYQANGVYTPTWFPTPGSTESTFALGASHQALEPYRAHCLWVAGLNMSVAVAGAGEQHQRGIGAVLTGTKIGTGTFVGNDGTRAGWASSISLDQLLVQRIGQTRVPSLQLGVNARERDVSGCVSYAGPSQPLLPQNDPRITFRNLFGSMPQGPLPTDQTERLRRQRASVLDAVKTQLTLVMRRAGTEAKQRLDAHFTKVRELERRLTALPAGTCTTPLEPPALSVETEAAMPEVARLQLELLALAFQCDLTRVATVMMSDAKNHIAMPFIDVTGDVHNHTHESDGSPTRIKVANRDQWVVEQIASLLEKLGRERDPTGTPLLDNTLVFLGSDVSRGNVHAHDDMPFLLAGHAAGWRMGRYLRYNGQSHNNLLVSMLQGFGGSDTTFGDANFCTGALTGLI